MTHKVVEYYLDKNKLIHITMDHLSANNLMMSIFNDRNSSSVWLTANKEELKGMADFIYQTIGENND